MTRPRTSLSVRERLLLRSLRDPDALFRSPALWTALSFLERGRVSVPFAARALVELWTSRLSGFDRGRRHAVTYRLASSHGAGVLAGLPALPQFLSLLTDAGLDGDLLEVVSVLVLDGSSSTLGEVLEVASRLLDCLTGPVRDP